MPTNKKVNNWLQVHCHECIDFASSRRVEYSSVIISDYGNHRIKIFSQSEQLIHTIGRKGKGMGEFMYPHGICISKLGTIFVVSNNPNFSIQCFSYCIPV